MIQRGSKNEARLHVHERLRATLRGTPQRPRLNVFRSLKHIYAQVIDDSQGRTLAGASSAEKGVSGGGNLSGAKAVGKLIAERAKAKGIESVAFDRSGFRYHGRVKALADAAREGGLKF